MTSEQFSLCWDNFHKNMSMGMRSMLETEDLVDVTLAVEGRYLKAHKMVLSVCSPYFRELFQSNPCKHPIMFMQNVSYIALTDLLQFMYQGEVQVAQENLPTFIKTAEALQIKGLTGDNGGLNDSETEPEIDKASVETTATKRSHENSDAKVVASLPRAKKFSGPASKRPKISNGSSTIVTTTPTQSIASTSNKYEVTSVNTGSNNSESLDDVNLKVEPNENIEQSQTESLEDNQLEQYTDSNAFEMTDENEDFSLMESGNDDPKPGTSAEGGDNQDHEKSWFGQQRRKKMARTRYVVNGFVYHTSVVRTNPAIRYLICSKYGSTGCHARAILPLNGSIETLRVTRGHNHPPDDLVEEKYLFFNQLKEITQASPNSALKIIFEGVISAYPRLSSELSFQSIRTSMRRWRKEVT